MLARGLSAGLGTRSRSSVSVISSYVTPVSIKRALRALGVSALGQPHTWTRLSRAATARVAPIAAMHLYV
jgi:hypothetical protein